MTGHAEVAQVVFDPNVISYGELLEVFWQTHDPTTLTSQGADVGPQYRSAIFYHNEKQRELAAGYKKKLDDSGAYNNPIATEISPLTVFYVSNKYHQDSFCSIVIKPYFSLF